MVSSINNLPLALRSRASVQSMATQLDKSRQTAAKLRAENRKPPSLIKVAIPAAVGAFTAGYVDAKMPDVFGDKIQPSVAVGIAVVTAGYLTESETAMHAGIAMLTPQAYMRGVNAAGFDIHVIATTPEEEPEAVAA